MMIPKERKPVHPGDVLLEEFLRPMDRTQIDLAESMGVPVQRVNTLIRGKRNVSAETAILLGRILGTSAEFWMNLQSAYDLYEAQQKLDHVA